MRPRGAHPNFSSNRFSILGSPIEPSAPPTPQKLAIFSQKLQNKAPSLFLGYYPKNVFLDICILEPE